ncbi:potassium channel family protein [Dietzia sp.]|uniref:potassium channel family protein n=1 Tax=Dietzia sp. TaxID=1871616 RepID=UPI002FDB58DA
MRVMIAGAGAVGRSIGRELIANGHYVLLVDKRGEVGGNDGVPGAEWLVADACELDSLERLGLSSFDVVVAATGDDKANVVLSLLAKTEFAVQRVVARVNDPRNEWLFGERWGVDVAVSTPRLIAAAVEEAVAVGDVVELLTLRGGENRLVSYTLPAHTTLAGRAVARLSLPRDTSLVSIIRGGRVIVPDEDVPFEPGDELLFVARVEALEALTALLLDSSPGTQSR